LLLPVTLELALNDSRFLIKRAGELSRLGVEIEHFGGNTFLLRAVPALLKKVRWEEFLSDLIPHMEKGPLEADVVLDNILTVMACHGAIRAGDSLSHEEMIQILRELEEMDLPTNCPHGRPVFRRFTYHELEKMFKRIV
jgi:DNA mismatch repair protein MutL